MVRLLDIKEAARYCGVGLSTFKKWKSTGMVRSVPMPIKKLLFDKFDLDEVINRNKEDGSCTNEQPRDPERFTGRRAGGYGYSNLRPAKMENRSSFQPEPKIANKLNEPVENTLKKWSAAYRLMRTR